MCNFKLKIKKISIENMLGNFVDVFYEKYATISLWKIATELYIYGLKYEIVYDQRTT